MLKYLVKDSIIYGAANLLQKLVPVLVIPVITTYFGKDALKLYDVSFVYAYLFSWLIILGQDNAMAILYFSNKTELNKRSVLKHGLLIQLTFLLLVAIVFLPLRNLIAGSLFSSDVAVAAYWLKALLIIPGFIVLNYVQGILLWQERKKHYVVLALMYVLLSLAGIFLTVYLNGGIDGVFYSLIGSSTITSFTGLLLLNKQLEFYHFSFDRSLLKQLLWMGIPFALTAFFQQLVPSIDRYFLLQYQYASDMAQYALAVKVGGLLSIASSAFILAFTPYSMKRIFEKEGEQQLSALFHIVSSALLLCVPLILLFKDVLIELFADASYSISVKLLPVFFIGWAFDLFFYFSILGVYKSKKAHLMLFIFMAGIVFIALLNFLLVPSFGVYGAAISFCVTKMFLFFVPLLALRRHFRLTLNPSFPVFFCVAVLCSYLIYQLPFYQSLLVVAVAVTAALFYLNTVLQKHKQMLAL